MRAVGCILAVTVGCSSSGTLIVVTVDASTPIAGVQTLHLVASGGGRARSFSLASPSPTIPPAQTVGIDVPPNVKGTFALHVEVLDAGGATLGAADRSFALSTGRRNDVTLDVAAGAPVPDLAEGDDFGLGPDLAYVAACGNGIRDPLEGCDDGNTVSQDGCSATCAVEPDFRAPFVGTALSLNGAWMAVASTGVIYIKQAGSGAAAGADSIYMIDTAATVTPNAIAGIASTYGGDLRTIGNDLYGCGDYPTTTTLRPHHYAVCQKWANGATSAPTTVLNQIDLSYYSSFATSDGTTWWFDVPGDFRMSTSATTSTQISTTVSGGLIYHPTLGILVANGSSIMKDTSGSGAGSFANVYSLGAGNVGVMALDRNGMLWATCSVDGAGGPMPCAAGSVWLIDLSAGIAKPAVDSFALVQSIAYDPGGHNLVLLARNKLWRFPN